LIFANGETHSIRHRTCAGSTPGVTGPGMEGSCAVFDGRFVVYQFFNKKLHSPP
jgi:hypothetical protein